MDRQRRHGPAERATPPLAASSQVAAAPGARPIVAGQTPHRSGLHQANRSIDAAVWSAGMHARAALTCHLSPIRPGASRRCTTFPRIGSRWHPPVSNLPAYITREVWRGIDSTMVSVDTLVSANAQQSGASRIKIELAHGDRSRCGTARRRRSSVRGPITSPNSFAALHLV